MRRYTQDNSYFESIDCERKAYWLGFLYADGCVYENKVGGKSVIITLHPKDKYILEEFLKDLKSDRKVNIDSRGYAGIRIGSIKIANDLIKLGCIPRKSLVLKFPTEDIVPRDLVNHFIRGYMDGDGCISTKFKKHKNRINEYYYCEIKFIGTYNMLDMIKKYFNSEKKVLVNKHSSNSYQISFSGKKYRHIVDSLYDGATIYLERKKKKWDSFINYIDSNVKRRYYIEEKNCNLLCRKNYEGNYKFKNNEIRFKLNKKEVKQYDLQGNFIKTWVNASSAAEKYNTTSKSIRRVCTGDRKSCCNYIWRYTEGVELKECRMVEQYDLNNNLIKVWKSCREAAGEYNVTFQAIRRAINGQYKTCCGYVWKYKTREN